MLHIIIWYRVPVDSIKFVIRLPKGMVSAGYMDAVDFFYAVGEHREAVARDEDMVVIAVLDSICKRLGWHVFHACGCCLPSDEVPCDGDEFPHRMDDGSCVENFDFEWRVTKFHQMPEIDGDVPLFPHLQQPWGTVVSAVRSIEDLFRYLPDQDQRFHASRKAFGRDGTQHRRLDQLRADDFGAVDIANHRFCEWLHQPFWLISVFEIDGWLQDNAVHRPVENMQHKLFLSMFVLLSRFTLLRNR